MNDTERATRVRCRREERRRALDARALRQGGMIMSARNACSSTGRNDAERATCVLFGREE